MNLFLACGSVVEVFTGAVCSTLVCIVLLIFFGIKYSKSDSYGHFKAAGTAEKSVIVILFFTSLIIVLIFAWFILTFLFSLIAALFT